MRRLDIAGGVVINKKGEVAVVNQNNNSWSLPKGHIDPGEDPLTAAKREINEECGIADLTFIKELGYYLRPSYGEDDSATKLRIVYLFTTDQKELKPTDPENPEARFVPKSQVADLLTHPKDKNFFLEILNELEMI